MTQQTLEELSAATLRAVIDDGRATAYLAEVGALVGAARRLLRARAKANAHDFETALAELARAVGQ